METAEYVFWKWMKEDRERSDYLINKYRAYLKDGPSLKPSLSNPYPILQKNLERILSSTQNFD